MEFLELGEGEWGEIEGGGGEEKKEREGRGKEGGLWIKKDDHIPVLVYPDMLKCR